MTIRNVFIIFMSLLLTTSCGQPNVLTEYSNTDSDEALYLDAKNKLDDSDWDGAINIITTELSSSYQARVDVKETLMYAYGGKCGIDFFELVNQLKNVSSSKMFEFALQIFNGKVVDVAACDNAVAVLRSIGTTAAARTNSQNLFAAILGLTRMATTLHAKLDTESSGLGNGIVDAGWDSCTNSSAAGRLSDAEVDKIVTGVGLIFENLAVLGGELTSGSAGGAFDAAKTLCETTIPLPAIGEPHDWEATIPPGTGWDDPMLDLKLPASPTWADLGLPADVADPIDCLNTDDTAVPAKMRRIFRRLISSSTQGFGTCDVANVTFNFDENANRDVLPYDPLITAASNCCPALATP
ncbi:hypothetical protein QJS83_03200 [Bdellovibrio sp. 22V]|uniref:hypothetical protein n=1 Tax=Bdellovibrio TaxID=958 RepID=UPI002543993E|nr:hypothetical protein [Bdellovibrio sp. 22V]WII72876.1 hypothetical protein QJS83_03200 [Bdellovibrio sp. 22V]